MKFFYNLCYKNLVKTIDELLNTEHISIEEKNFGIKKLFETPLTLETLNEVDFSDKQAVLQRILNFMNASKNEGYFLNDNVKLLKEELTRIIPPPYHLVSLF